MNDPKQYQDPLAIRYASPEMSFIFSPYSKFLTWRKLWIALAKGQKALGLPITDSQINALEKAADKIDLKRADEFEKTFRHDVMAHIHAYGEECPEAKGIIHLGATSCYVTDNADLIQMREGLTLLHQKIIQALRHLKSFAAQYASLPCLSYTHFQPAQPTTVGKRACLWIQDLLIDLKDLEYVLDDIHFLGVKGATGTQASFVTLFNGDAEKVKQLEELVKKEMGFSKLFSISGQTYTRKQDIRILNVLSSLGASVHKFATDMRLLAHLKEIEEPFAQKQVGSSAMPYKRNPMRCERICGISRYLISLHENALYTEATQWLERSLDDSSNRRLYIGQAFLAADALLNLLCNVTAGMIVHPKVIARHLHEELPFLATEHILMEAVQKGKDRQHVHERLRVHSLESGRVVKEEGKPCDLFERIAQDPDLNLSLEDLTRITQIENFIGRAPSQTEEFLREALAPILNKHQHIKTVSPTISL